MISKTIGFFGVHNIFRQTQMLWLWMDMDGVGVEAKEFRILDIFGTWLDW